MNNFYCHLFVCKVKDLLLLHLLYESEHFNCTSGGGLSYYEGRVKSGGTDVESKSMCHITTEQCNFLLLQFASGFIDIEIIVYPTESNFVL